MSTERSKAQKSSREETVKKHEVIPPAIRDVLASEGALSLTDLRRAVADPRTARPPEILGLQHSYGNEAVQRLLANHHLQARLIVGAANDSYEQEADRVAAQVMSAPAQAPDVQRQGEEEEEIQTKPLAATITPLIQRQPIPEEEEEELLQGKFIQRQSILEEEEEPLQGKSISGGRAFSPSTDFESRLAATRGSGRPLPKTTRDFMESRFGVDFSGVRLHTNGESARLNREISAQAFTRGQDVYLGEGKENSESKTEMQLLAHELTHVVQQNGRAVNRSPLPSEPLSQHSTTKIPSASMGNRLLQIQRKTIAVAGGEFNDSLIGSGYRASNEDESDSRGTYRKVGAKMELAFVPKPSLDAKQVSLVQTTHSTVRNETNPSVPDQSQSLLDKRRTEGGTAIDQEIYLSKAGNQQWDTDRLLPLFESIAGLGMQAATNTLIQKFIAFFTTGAGSNNQKVVLFGTINPNSIKTQLSSALASEDRQGAGYQRLAQVIPKITHIIALQAKRINLDPRYSEERTKITEPLKAPRRAGSEAGSGGWTAEKGEEGWKSSAALRDAPGHKIAPTDVVNGDERFEVAAMADGQKFLGSIRWGYTVTNSVSTLNPASIGLVNYGSASGELFKAAQKWNSMKVPDLYNEEEKHSTIQLPESDNAKNSPLTAFNLARWMPSEEVIEVMDGLGRETIEKYYDTASLGHIRQGVTSAADLIKLVIKLTEKRGPDAITILGQASQHYSSEGYKALCAKGIDEIITAIYPQRS